MLEPSLHPRNCDLKLSTLAEKTKLSVVLYTALLRVELSLLYEYEGELCCVLQTVAELKRWLLQTAVTSLCRPLLPFETLFIMYCGCSQYTVLGILRNKVGSTEIGEAKASRPPLKGLGYPCRSPQIKTGVSNGVFSIVEESVVSLVLLHNTTQQY